MASQLQEEVMSVPGELEVFAGTSGTKKRKIQKITNFFHVKNTASNSYDDLRFIDGIVPKLSTVIVLESLRTVLVL